MVQKDRHPGPREDEEVILDEDTVHPTIEGGMRYVSGSFSFRDSVGTYDPRAGSSLLGRAVFKIDGGLVYTTDGDVVIKETA